MADLDVAPTRHISASEARAAGPSSTDASTSDSEESRGVYSSNIVAFRDLLTYTTQSHTRWLAGEVGRKELRKRGDLSRSRKRSRR